jgi:hypothetical protein
VPIPILNHISALPGRRPGTQKPGRHPSSWHVTIIDTMKQDVTT